MNRTSARRRRPAPRRLLRARGLRRRSGDPQEHRRARCPTSRRSTRSRRPRIPGIYELRVGTDILYTDENGNYLIEGQLIDTKTRANLTEQRIAKLTAIDFKTPAAEGRDRLEAGHRRAQARRLRRSELRLLQEVRARPAGGQGRHRLHLPVSDPRRRFAGEVEGRSGAPRTTPRPGATGCSRARRSTSSPQLRQLSACSATSRFGKKHRINGTPGLVFEDGSQRAGALNAEADREAARRDPRASPDPRRPTRRRALHPVARVLAVDQPLQRGERVLAGAVLRVELERVGDALLEHRAAESGSPRPRPASPAAPRRRGSRSTSAAAPAAGCAPIVTGPWLRSSSTVRPSALRRMRSPSSAWTVMPSKSWYATLP